MNIAIDLTALYGRKRTGVEMYAIDLYKALLTTGHKVIPIFHVKNEIDQNPDAYIIPKSNRLLLENALLSKAIRRIKPEKILFPIFPPPIDLYMMFNGEIIPTIHDFAFLRFRNTLNFSAKYYLTPKILLSFKFANEFITISKTEERILHKYTDRPIYNLGENISIEFKNADQKASLTYLKKWGLIEGNYFISVSTMEPRKNFKYLLKVIEPVLKKKNMKLVLVGRKGWGEDQELRNSVERMKEQIIFTDYISEEELISLYHYAFAFILLSMDEGFGRTPYEAVACGCKRIILSDIEIFHETFQTYATFLPLDDCKKSSLILKSLNFPIIPDNFPLPFNVIEKRLNEIIRRE